jgi:adenylate cyclase
MTIDQPDPSLSTSLCVLFADVCGSTQLYEVLGDKEAALVIGNCIKGMDYATRLYGGTTVQIIGDEILATFPNPDLGIQAATDMMHRVELEEEVAGKRLALRIGFHYGPVLRQNNYLFNDQPDIFGDTVNTAARIAKLAKSHQILTSAETAELLPAYWQQATRHLDAFTLKGKSEDIRICEILWEKQENTTIIRIPSLSPQDRLTLHYLQQRYVLDGNLRSVTLGREPGNDIVIDDRRISRQHARIERRRNKFVLIDSSTNGTHVTVEGYSEIPVRMEEFILYGRGHISLGHAYDSEDPISTLIFEVL